MSLEMSAENKLTDAEESSKSSIDLKTVKESTLEKKEGTEIMSKRQRKKLMKQKQWEEQRDLRKYGFASWVMFCLFNNAEKSVGCLLLFFPAKD